MNTCNSPAWTIYALDGVLFAAALMSVYVMIKADRDQQINRIDARWLRSGRSLAFVAVSMSAFVTILTDISMMALLLLFLSAATLLIIDAIALNQRPPQQGTKAIERGHYIVAHRSPRHAFGFFRNWFK